MNVFRYTDKEKGWFVLHDILTTKQQVRKYKKLAKTGDYFFEN